MITAFWDKQGRPLTLVEANILLADPIYRIVARDIWDGVTVSTVWTGADHKPPDDTGDPPWIFETVVFGGPYNGARFHYTTEHDAIIGHNRVAAETLTALGHQHDQQADDLDPHRSRH
jgi:hypothetical protein